jgi:hypothetical protein
VLFWLNQRLSALGMPVVYRVRALKLLAAFAFCASLIAPVAAEPTFKTAKISGGEAVRYGDAYFDPQYSGIAITVGLLAIVLGTVALVVSIFGCDECVGSML